MSSLAVGFESIQNNPPLLFVASIPFVSTLVFCYDGWLADLSTAIAPASAIALFHSRIVDFIDRLN